MINYTNKDKNGSNIEDYSMRQTFVIINCVLNAPLMLISILGNALVLAAIIRTPSIRSTTTIMLCSLAVSDLLVGLTAQPLYLADLLTEENFVDNLTIMVGFSVCGVTLWTTTAISVDRFLALHYHMRYATLVTESRVLYTVLTIWLINIPFSGFYLCKEREYKFTMAIMTIICLVVSTFSYILIYRIVRRHQSQIYVQQTVQSVTDGVQIGRLKKSALNTFIFYIFLITCYIPMYILLTLYGISYMEWTIEWNFIIILVFMNSSINPVLYCWRLRELRTAVVKTARQMLCKQTEEN